MGLSEVLRRFAAARPQLLVVEGAGGSRERLAVERWSRERGWPVVDVPADADVLVLVGTVDAFGDRVERVWNQLPGPRAQARLAAGDDVGAALARSRTLLTDLAAQRQDVRRTERPPPGMPAGTGDMDMGDMDMGMPAGLGMADRAPDRDGLKLDVLTVPWGPVLPWWPDGLVVTTVLQGDVVQSATVERLGSDRERRDGWAAALVHLDPPLAAAVVRLDALVRLLGVAGWDGARLRCQRVRDALLTGQDSDLDLHRLAHRVSRSRVLGRMTSGIVTTGGQDVAERYRGWLAEVVAAVEGGVLPPPVDEPHALRQLADAVTGLEVAGMRLVVASLDLALSGADARKAADV